MKPNISFEKFIDELEIKYIDDKIDKINNQSIWENLSKTSEGKVNICESFKSLNINVQQMLLENFIQAKAENINKNKIIRDLILDCYKSNISIKGQKIIRSLIEDKVDKIKIKKNE